MDISNFGAIFIIAIVSSFGHCISMCGGFVLSYSSVKINTSWSRTYQSLMHLLYGLGRTFSYSILGGIFGYLGSVVSVSMSYKGALFVVLGSFMCLLAISFIDKMIFLKYLKIDILELKAFKKIHFHTFKSQKAYSFFVFGVLNGLIPCGLVYFFASSAIATSSLVNGALSMAIFGLCTIPALFIVGFTTSFVKSKHFKFFNYISSFLIMSYGVITFIKGLLMLSGAGHH